MKLITKVLLAVFTVSLILSVAILIITSFFRDRAGSYGELEQKLTVQLSNQIRLSGENLVLSGSRIEMKPGAQADLYYAIRNGLDSDKTFLINSTGRISSDGAFLGGGGVIGCYDEKEKVLDDTIIFNTTQKRSIKKGEIAVLMMDIRVADGSQPGNHVCTIVITTEDNPDLAYMTRSFYVNIN